MSEQVFVWIDHGEVTVYSADTKEQLQNILESVYSVMVKSLYDEDCEVVKQMYEKEKSKNPKKLTTTLIQKFAVDWESFEYGTGFYEVKEKCT